MRAIAICLGAAILMSCAADPDVVAEQRTPSDRLPVDENDTRVTAPPVEPPDSATPAPPQASIPAPTAPSDSADLTADASYDSSSALLLATGDLPGVSVGSTGQRGPTPDPYGRSDCPMLDLVRSVDSYRQVSNSGALDGVQFYNMVIDVGSDAAADRIMEAARLSPQECPEFVDRNGPGRLEPLELPTAGMWDPAGLMIATQQRSVSIGLWRSGTVIVKLRVVGSAAESQFLLLARTIARKLDASTRTQQNAEPPVDWADDEHEDEAWRWHPQAWRVLEDAEVGEAWTRYSVVVDEPWPAGAPVEVCGVAPPARAGGLSADFDHPDGTVVTQTIMDGTDGLAVQWIDFYEVLGDCGVIDDGSAWVTYEVVANGAALVAGADDVVVVRAMRSEDGVPTASMVIGVLRVGGVVVQVVAAQYADATTTSPPTEPSVDEVLRLLAASID